MDRRTFLATLAATVTAAAADKKTPRLLLKSGWQTVNIGDIGHTPGMLTLLAKHLPQVQVTLWPNDIKDGVKPMLQKNFPNVKYAETAAEVTAAFEENDFLLHGSGPSLVAAKPVQSWIDKAKKPYGILGITISSVDDSTRGIFNGAKFVYTRDTLSLALAKKEKLTPPVLAFAPDAAFAVDLRDDTKADVFLKKHQLEAGKFLCVIPKYRNTPYWLIRNKPMTDADKAKDKVNQAMKESDFAKVRPAILAFLAATPHKVLLCPEDKSHVAINKEMFLDKLADDVKGRVVWKDDYWLTDEAMSVYLKSLGLLSMDMHSPIMCIGNGVPAIHCRFKEQTTKGQMWNDIGLKDWLFDLDAETDGKRITKALMEMVNDTERTKFLAGRAKAFVDAEFASAFGVLGKSL